MVSQQEKKLNVLISGAGIAGPLIAIFLGRAGHRMTIVERSPVLRLEGQQVDIRGAGIEVLRRIGKDVEAEIRSRRTGELGMRFVDSNDNVIAEMGATEALADWKDAYDEDGNRKLTEKASNATKKPVKQEQFTAEIEILRGEIAKIFYDRSIQECGDRLEYIFGKEIVAIRDDPSADKVSVDIGPAAARSHSSSSSSPERAFTTTTTHEFDLIIGADGLGSRARSLAFDPHPSPIHSLGFYTANFTIPHAKSDGQYARWYNAPGGRLVVVRPDERGVTRVSLGVLGTDNEKVNSLRNSQTRDESTKDAKAAWRQIFQGAGWETDRVLKGMDAAGEFYESHIAQIRMQPSPESGLAWSKGRVVLVGDAAFCPTLLTGMGTTSAVIGAYTLAGEISRSPENIPAAFRRYEVSLQPFITKVQKLPSGMPGMMVPQTAIGVGLMHAGLRFLDVVNKLVLWFRLDGVVGSVLLLGPQPQSLELTEFGLEQRKRGKQVVGALGA